MNLKQIKPTIHKCVILFQESFCLKMQYLKTFCKQMGKIMLLFYQILNNHKKPGFNSRNKLNYKSDAFQICALKELQPISGSLVRKRNYMHFGWEVKGSWGGEGWVSGVHITVCFLVRSVLRMKGLPIVSILFCMDLELVGHILLSMIRCHITQWDFSEGRKLRMCIQDWRHFSSDTVSSVPATSPGLQASMWPCEGTWFSNTHGFLCLYIFCIFYVFVGSGYCSLHCSLKTRCGTRKISMYTELPHLQLDLCNTPDLWFQSLMFKLEQTSKILSHCFLEFLKMISNEILECMNVSVNNDFGI